VSEPILLLLFTSAPIGWWVVLSKHGQLFPFSPFSPIAYITAAILTTCTASYTLTIRLYPGLGWGKNATTERHAKNVQMVLVLALTLAATGILPDSDKSITRYFYLVIYALSVGNLFLIHFIVSMRDPVIDSSGPVQSELSDEQRAGINAVHFIGGPFLLAAIATYLLWLAFQYDNQLLNHATLFGTLFGVFIAVASRFRQNRIKESI
jgi:hypothetical protein